MNIYNFIFNCFSRVKNYLIILIAVFIIAVILGLFCKIEPSNCILNQGLKYSITFNELADFNKNLLTKLLLNLGLLVIIGAFSITIYATPLYFLIIVYKGLIIGCTISFIISKYFILGFVLLLIQILPSNFLISFSMIFLSATGINSALRAKKCNKINIYEILTNFIIASFLILLAIIWELIVFTFIIKPINLIC